MTKPTAFYGMPSGVVPNIFAMAQVFVFIVTLLVHPAVDGEASETGTSPI